MLELGWELKVVRDPVAGVGGKLITSEFAVAERESHRNERERILAARREAKARCKNSREDKVIVLCLFGRA